MNAILLSEIDSNMASKDDIEVIEECNDTRTETNIRTPDNAKPPRYAALSRYLSWTLDMLGFSQLMRYQRQEAYQKLDALRNKSEDDLFTEATVGSKGEGLTSVYESDTDVLIIANNLLVIDDQQDEEYTIPPNVKVVKMDYSSCYPGHTMLRITGEGPKPDDWQYESVRELPNGQKFLSNTVVKMLTSNVPEATPATRSGPAVAHTVMDLPRDLVVSFRCKAKSFINKWTTRPRRYDWPPNEVIDEVSEVDANVVGTGFADSENKDLEWRICFNIHETLLVRHLNDTHAKLYVLLKLVMKKILKPQNKELTSYVMKNIVFWLAELNPQSLFTQETLCEWLFKALCRLKWCLENIYLPYYMIPERNLLAGKMEEKARQRMLRRVRFVMQTGPICLLRYRKLAEALVEIEPELLDLIGKRRDTMENLELLTMTKAMEYKTGESDREQETEKLNKMLRLKMMITLPNYMTLAIQGEDIHALADKETKRVLG